MKLQVSFDLTDLEKALTVAKQIEQYVDIFEIGSLLIDTEGARAVEQFRSHFPDMILLADTKIVDRGEDTGNLFFSAGADWVTVMSGTSDEVIAAVCRTADGYGKKVMLDLLDSDSYAQSALDAKNLGVDAIMYHMPHDGMANQTDFLIDNWELVRENTKLPLFIAPRCDLKKAETIIKELHPAGLIVGSAIIEADDPAEAAEHFSQLVKK